MWRIVVVGAFWLLASGATSLAQECSDEGKSCMPGYIACASGTSCPLDRKCSTDGLRCLSKGMTDCGSYSCGPGKFCGPVNSCVVKNTTTVRQSHLLEDSHHKDPRSAKLAVKAAAAYRSEDDKTPLSIKPFIESRSSAAQSAASSIPPAGSATPGRGENGLHPAPANALSTNRAITMQGAPTVSSTATAITELQAQIKTAEENRASLERQMTELQAKMQALSLKKWQEEVDQIKAAAPASQAIIASNAESTKVSCKILGAVIGDKFQLHCERQIYDTEPHVK